MLAFNPPPIFGLGTAGGFEFYLQNRGEGGAQAPGRGDAAVPRSAPTRTRSSPACRRSGAPNVPQLYVDVDREKAKALGVPVDDVFDALPATLGTLYVNDFNKFGRTWQVLMSAEPGYRKRPDDIGTSTCARTRATMIPLASLANRARTRRARSRSTASTICRR